MKAVLVFCEGRHDVIFAERSLLTNGNCRRFNGRIRELPSPFGPDQDSPGKAIRKGLIEKNVEQTAIKDMRLSDRFRFPVPCFASIVENTEKELIFFLMQTEGQDQSGQVLKFLEDLNLVIEKVNPKISQYAAAFLYDADHEGVEHKLMIFRDRYNQHFGDLSALRHGQWLGGTTPVGCFVFHGSDQTGTIENHLAPMAKRSWPDRYAAAEALIDDNRHDGDKVSDSKSNAKRLKAIITVAGQFNHPGYSLSVIMEEHERNGILKEQFEKCAVSNELARFLLDAPLAPEHR